MRAAAADRVGDNDPGDPVASPTTEFDFRRPSKLGREVSRGLELAHETFARRVGTGWGSELRAYVQIDPAGAAQLPYDDVIRSMPSPHLLVTARVPPLAGSIVVEMDLQLGMLLVDRLLGGVDDESLGGLRRPSEVEVELLGHLGQHAVHAVGELLAPLGCEDVRMAGVDTNPQLVQVAAPSDPALLVSFTVTVSGPLEANGTMSIIYPGQLQNQLLDHLAATRGSDAADRHVDAQVANDLLSNLGAAEVDVAVRLADSPVPAGLLHGLAVGDVLRLKHRVGRPAQAVIGETPFMDVHLGRLGPRRAAQVAEWHTHDEPPPTSRRLLSHVAGGLPAGDQAPEQLASPEDNQ